MKLIREILIEIESDRNSENIEGYQPEEVKYHQFLMIQAGLLSGDSQFTVGNTSKVPTIVDVNDLTWNGHEFLSSIRDNEVWETIKSDFKEASVDTIIKVAKQLAEGFAKKKVELLLEGSDTT